MEINVVLKDAGKAFIVTDFRQMTIVKRMSTHADYLRVLSGFIALALSTNTVENHKRPTYDKEHCLYRREE